MKAGRRYIWMRGTFDIAALAVEPFVSQPR